MSDYVTPSSYHDIYENNDLGFEHIFKYMIDRYSIDDVITYLENVEVHKNMDLRSDVVKFLQTVADSYSPDGVRRKEVNSISLLITGMFYMLFVPYEFVIHRAMIVFTLKTIKDIGWSLADINAVYSQAESSMYILISRIIETSQRISNDITTDNMSNILNFELPINVISPSITAVILESSSTYTHTKRKHEIRSENQRNGDKAKKLDFGYWRELMEYMKSRSDITILPPVPLASKLNKEASGHRERRLKRGRLPTYTS